MRRVPSAQDSVMAAVRLEGIEEDYWRFLQSSRPEVVARATTLITSLPDPTQDDVKKDAQFARAALAALDEVYVDALRQDDYVTWLSLRWDMEAQAGWSAFHWTNLSHLSPGNSVFDKAISILKSQVITDPVEAQRFVSTVDRVSTLASQVRSEYLERARRDIRLPSAVAERAAGFLRELIAPGPASPFWLPREFTGSADSSWHSEITRRLTEAISERVNPSLDSLAAFIEGEQVRGSDMLGLSRLPGGAIHYATLLRYRTTLDITPEEAHAVGLREVARLAALAAAARRDARLPVDRDSLRATFRNDPAFLFDERSSIPERTAQLLERASKDLDSLFGVAPALALSIGLIPNTISSAPLAIYDLPTLTRPTSLYLLNLDEVLARSAFVLPGLVASDLMPGLRLQQATQLENDQLPSFRRLGFHDGFVRGWQAYALGVADSLSQALEPWQRFSMRLRELAFACGLVVDTGINALGWSRADALGFLRAYLPEDDDDLEREFIFPASELPGLLAAATLGAREFRGLRLWAMRELGDRFTLPAFHREVLRVGSVPLPVLGTHLERWIWDLNHPAPATRPRP
jgi:uncharacterized protein (DUF885 family)